MVSLIQASSVRVWKQKNRAGPYWTATSNGYCVNLKTSDHPFKSGKANGAYTCVFYSGSSCLGAWTKVGSGGVNSFWFGNARSVRC